MFQQICLERKGMFENGNEIKMQKGEVCVRSVLQVVEKQMALRGKMRQNFKDTT